MKTATIWEYQKKMKMKYKQLLVIGTKQHMQNFQLTMYSKSQMIIMMMTGTKQLMQNLQLSIRS